MFCSPDRAVPNRVTLAMLVSKYPIPRAHKLNCKKPELSLDQYYLTGNTGVLLEKTWGALKGCVLDHLFCPELLLQGWQVAGVYTAAQLEAAQHIWLSP